MKAIHLYLREMNISFCLIFSHDRLPHYYKDLLKIVTAVYCMITEKDFELYFCQLLD